MMRDHKGHGRREDERNSREEEDRERRELNRRRFLLNLGRGAAGLALGSAAFGLLSESGWSQTTAADSATSKGSASAGATSGSSHASATSPSAHAAGTPSRYDLSTVKGDDPGENARRAVDAIGGIKRFVSKGDVVVVKPNIGWDRSPEMAANTNPAVVATLVAMALEAGASKVKVFDHPCANMRAAYKHSGIQEAAEKAGAVVVPFDNARCKKVAIPNAEFLKEWAVFPDILECDCVIDCPVAKVHGSSVLTLGIKNLMGVAGGNRGGWHQNLHASLADFLGLVKPQLTVIDGYRIMVSNGPTGGSLRNVKMPKTCIASSDIVSADARATALFNLKPTDVDHIVRAARMGYGQIDLSKVASVELG